MKTKLKYALIRRESYVKAIETCDKHLKIYPNDDVISRQKEKNVKLRDDIDARINVAIDKYKERVLAQVKGCAETEGCNFCEDSWVCFYFDK